MAPLILTQSQIEEFRTNGLLVVEDFLSQNEVREVKEEIFKLVDEMDPSEHKGVFSTTSRSQVCNKATIMKLSNKYLI